MIYRLLVLVCVLGLCSMSAFIAGIEYRHAQEAKLEVTQLNHDTQAAGQIEGVAHEREAKVIRTVQVVREAVDDCLARPMPVAALDGLRDAGLPTRSSPAP